MNTEHTNQSRQAEPATHSPIALQSIPKRQRDFTAENIRDIAHECMRIGDNEQAEVVFAIADALRDGNLIIQSPAQQQAEPVALSLPFFAYDSETGFERFATEAEAKAAAQESIEAYREDAGEGWAEEVENICWGVVLGTTREVALPDEYSGGNGLADSMKPVDYVLTDAAQPPAVAVAVPDGVLSTMRRASQALDASSCHKMAAQLREARHLLDTLAAAPQAADPIKRLIAMHNELLGEYPYCYFELAYTRRTDWMAWLCTKPREDDPERKVLACGQGLTAEEACAEAIAAIQKGGTP